MVDLLTNLDAQPGTRKGKKTVGGVEFTPELRSIATCILELELSPPDLTNSPTSADDENIDLSFDGPPEDWIPTSAPAEHESIQRISAVRRALAPMSREEAIATLKSSLDSNSTTLPLQSLKAMSDALKALSGQYPGGLQASDEIRARLEKALFSSKLKFDVEEQKKMSKEEMEEASKFEKRMYRLRMKAEETKYHKLTHNLEKPFDDEINVKSMTYAASIGLNMIVAPISFGVLAYFISGYYLFPDAVADERRPGVVNAGKVICAVVSGVLMMFIEMILFVIRSNEMDYYSTKKKRKSSYGPFGNKDAARVAQRRENELRETALSITAKEN